MGNKVRWQRDNGVMTPYMFEEHSGRWMWVYWGRSHCNDNKAHLLGNASTGMRVFQNAIRRGYVCVEKVDD